MKSFNEIKTMRKKKCDICPGGMVYDTIWQIEGVQMCLGCFIADLGATIQLQAKDVGHLMGVVGKYEEAIGHFKTHIANIEGQLVQSDKNYEALRNEFHLWLNGQKVT